MPSRKIPFVNDHFYHIYNRGVAKIPIFNDLRDYKRFLKTMLYYQLEGPKPKFSHFSPTKNVLATDKKIVDIICYCLMPNHFHFLLRQTSDHGITEFLSKLSNSYTKYTNVKKDRVGPLFQGEFKSVYIETEEQLIHVSRYIHLNPLVSYLTKDLSAYTWSSYPEYIGIKTTAVCEKEPILSKFKDSADYEKFVLDQENYGKQLEFIKHIILDGKEE